MNVNTKDIQTAVSETMSETLSKLDRARTVAGEKTGQAVDAATSYVKENPWKSIGVLAAAGLVIGFLCTRR